MRDTLLPVRDILREIAFLQSIRDCASLESFMASGTDVRATCYSIIVISEAVRRIPEEWLSEHPEIPWHAIRTIGNKLRHEYQHVSEIILWSIVTEHVDALQIAVEDILARHS